MKITRKLIVTYILSALIFGLGIDRLNYIHQAAQTPSHSFTNYYTAALLLSQGEDVQNFYDNDWYGQRVLSVTPTIADIYQPHPPTTAFLMLPLVQLGHHSGRIVWTLITFLSVILTVGLILYRSDLDIFHAQLILLIVLVYQPLYDNFQYAQVYGVLFAMLTMMLYAYRYHRSVHTGIWLSLMLTFKLFGYLFIPLLIIKRRWLAIISMIVVTLSLVILTLPRLGIQSWLEFFAMLPKHNQRPSFAVTAYQSIPSFFRHQFSYHEFWNPSPLMNAPLVATVLSTGVIACLLIITFWRAHRTEQTDLLFGSLVLLTVLISPASLDYHFAIVLLPILLLIAQFPRMSSASRFTALLGVCLLTIDYPYQHSQYDDTFLSLFAYPKLIGALLLWSVTVHLMKDQPQDHQSSNSGA